MLHFFNIYLFLCSKQAVIKQLVGHLASRLTSHYLDTEINCSNLNCIEILHP